MAQAVRDWLPLGDQHRHRCLNHVRQEMLPDYISRTFALLVTYIAYRILFSTIVCDIAVLLVLVVAVSCLAFWRFWETIRVILFYRWFSWGRTIVCSRLMLSFFIKFPAGQCLMMYDDRYWYMETHVSCMSLAVTSNLHIKQNKNLFKNWILSIVQSNDHVQFPLCYQKEKSGGKLGKAAQELSGLVGTLNLSQRAFLLKWAMNIDNKYPRFINVLCKFPLVEHNLHF